MAFRCDAATRSEILLAEALYFLLAFFLTLSDHRRGIAKASKVPYEQFRALHHAQSFTGQRFEKKKKIVRQYPLTFLDST